MTENPLKQYSKRPGTYITLPSRGKYYDEKPKVTADDELEVRPMTAGDEIRLKNPDGLMNSDALFQVIEHVAPGIQNARMIPTPDLDVIVIGMRIATYGEEMAISAECPKCQTSDDFNINLTNVLAGAKMIEGKDQVEVGELRINIRPHTSESNTLLSNYQVELIRAARAIEGAVTDDKEPLNKQLAEIINKGSGLLFEIASKHIVNVITPDGTTVTEPHFIKEFLEELPAPEYEIIREGVNSLSKEVIDRKVKYKCSSCSHENTVEVAFDPANFFVNSSL